MVQLRDRNKSIPYGIKFFQSESGWDTDKIPALASASFERVKSELIKHRLGNPWLAKKHNWSTDPETVGNELSHYNALRMKANPRWSHFIIDDEGGSSDSAPFFNSRIIRFKNAVRVASKTVAGVGVLLSWLGSGGKAVPKELSEHRALTCVQCPKNSPGDLSTWLTEAASAEALKIFGMMSDLNLSTSQDDKLGVCSACACPLKSKVHTPRSHILDQMSDGVKSELNQENPRCWILSES